MTDTTTTPEEHKAELRTWLKENRHILNKYQSNELFEMAQICLPWVPELILYNVLSHYHDAIQGTNFDNRAKMHIDHETITIEMMSGVIHLSEYWFELWRYQTKGRDYDE